eukprot:Phypoly_transcript_00598.p1 GENE.Phypoly_transcript_00598~~Phypoly_transcript_00598.p1  ORF type:complete len:432 (-),score=105.57 Phypoly_transcript_00598:1020-2315(-)
MDTTVYLLLLFVGSIILFIKLYLSGEKKGEHTSSGVKRKDIDINIIKTNKNDNTTTETRIITEDHDSSSSSSSLLLLLLLLLLLSSSSSSSSSSLRHRVKASTTDQQPQQQQPTTVQLTPNKQETEQKKEEVKEEVKEEEEVEKEATDTAAQEADLEADADDDSDEDEDEDDEEEGKGKDLHEVVEHTSFGSMNIACVSFQGKRPKNEDRKIIQTVSGVLFCGIFDGHDGSKASEYCAKYLVKNITSQKVFSKSLPTALELGFNKTDKKFLDKMESSGSTAILAVVDTTKKQTSKNTLYIANVGDSRCVACVDGKAIALSTDHKPNLPEETARISKTMHDVQVTTEIVMGQRVKIARIDGMLAVSRAMGDMDFKDDPTKPISEQAVSSVPEITTIELTEQHEFVVLACDGLWDVLTNQEVDTIEYYTQKTL